MEKRDIKMEIQQGRNNILSLIHIVLVSTILGLTSFNLSSDEIVHKFKSHSFNGVNTCLLYTSASADK